MSRMMNKHRISRKASATDFQTDRGLDIEQPSTEDVRVKVAGAVKGKYVTLFQTPKNTLSLIPNNTAVAEFVNDNADHLGDDILAVVDPKGEKNKPGAPRHNVWGDKQILQELLSDLLTTSWHWLHPQDIGALTDAPILEAPDGRIYWHGGYQLESAADELLQGKTVTFEGAPENHTPVVAPEDEMPKTSAKKKKAVNEAPEDAAVAADTAADIAVDEPAPVEPIAPAVGGGNPYQDWKTQNLIETIESLTDSESFAQDKPEQKAVENMAEVLSARPVEPELEAQAKKSCLRKAAAVLRLVKRSSTVSDLKRSMNKFLDEEADEKEHKKAGFGGGFPAADQDNGEILEGDKSIPVGRRFEEDNTGITRPKSDSARKFADINDPAHNEDTGKVLDGDKSVAEQKEGVDDKTGIEKHPVETPGEVAKTGYQELGVKTAAAPITVDKAIKLVEDLAEELKTLYMDAKPITTVNETRQVREAVESIYHAMKALGIAQKILVKQQTQQAEEEAAAEANKTKAKKSSSLLAALKIAAPVEETTSHVASFKDRELFRAKVAGASSVEKEAAHELADSIMRSASTYGTVHRASEDESEEEPESKEASTQKKASLQVKISALARQMSCTALYRTAGEGKSVALKLASGEQIEVPTS